MAANSPNQGRSMKTSHGLEPDTSVVSATRPDLLSSPGGADMFSRTGQMHRSVANNAVAMLGSSTRDFEDRAVAAVAKLVVRAWNAVVTLFKRDNSF